MVATEEQFIRIRPGTDDKSGQPLWHVEMMADSRWRSVRACYLKQDAMDVRLWIQKSIRQSRQAARR
jgi:hypothetical protein